MENSGGERDPEEVDVSGQGMTEAGGRRPSELEYSRSKITHNPLENMGVLGQGLKQLFQHPRRRSSISPHDISAALSAAPVEPLEAEPQIGDTPVPDTDPSAPPPAALSRVLQQIRAAPMMKRGSSLQSRRKADMDPPKGIPQTHHCNAQDALIHMGRPRSSSSTSPSCSPTLAETLPNEPDLQKWDKLEISGLALWPAPTGSSTEGSSAVEGVDTPTDPQRSRQAIAQLQQKILRLTEQIKVEQTARDDNVAEYLKLANNADRQQSARIKQVFEKKNQKSAQTIQQLQRKLELSHRRLREAEQCGISRQPKHVLRDMHQGLKDVGAKVTGGLSTISQATHSAAGAVVSKPKEIASLIRNKFGSAENISGLKEALDEPQGEEVAGGPQQSSPRYGSEDECSTATSESAGANSITGAPGGPLSSKTNTLDNMQTSGLDMLFHEVQEIHQAQGQLEESFENLKAYYQTDYHLIMQALQDERYRCERLEEQLNDLTELHQNEILNLKQELASMEEKIAYQSYERGRDVQEALEACQTRISKMELQQQQVVQLEGLENAAGRPLLGKLINVLLALMAVLLVFVSTVANCTVPLMKTRFRTCSTLLLVILLAFSWRNWDAITQYLDNFLQELR